MRRWTAAYRFGFSPVISFERRKAALLDWVEDHLSPTSFRDQDDEVGIAIRRGVRLRVDRRSLSLEDSVATFEGVETLWPVVVGVLSTMEPRKIHLHSASIAWSEDLTDVDYETAASRLARATTGIADKLPSGAHLSDVATMVDLHHPDWSAQAEYGIVTPTELLDRIQSDSVGRVKGRPRGLLTDSALDDVPGASAFVDTLVFQNRQHNLDDLDAIRAEVAAYESGARDIATAICTSIVKREVLA